MQASSSTIPASSLPAHYRATEQDAIAYTRRCLIGATLVCAAYGLTVAGTLPVAVLLIAVGLILPRWMINFHELLHLHDEQQINPYIRLMGVSPLPLSPISLSYGQIKTLHAGHHAAPGTTEDPDAYHIRGHWAVAFVNAFIAPEQSTCRWLLSHGLTRQLAVDMGIKLLLFISLAWAGGLIFLWFWLSLRLVYGLGDFSFFRMVHHRNGEYGTFDLPLPDVVVWFGERVFGETVVQTTIHHDVHHQNPRIAAHALAMAREQLSVL